MPAVGFLDGARKASMHFVLATYAANHRIVSYQQGMTDIVFFVMYGGGVAVSDLGREKDNLQHTHTHTHMHAQTHNQTHVHRWVIHCAWQDGGGAAGGGEAGGGGEAAGGGEAGGADPWLASMTPATLEADTYTLFTALMDRIGTYFLSQLPAERAERAKAKYVAC